jgi:hypothetical protein
MDQRENARRETERSRIATLTGAQKQIAEDQEARKQQEYDKDRVKMSR